MANSPPANDSALLLLAHGLCCGGLPLIILASVLGTAAVVGVAVVVPVTAGAIWWIARRRHPNAGCCAVESTDATSRREVA